VIRRAHTFGLFLASTASVLLIWRLAQPALWLDESASVVATQRTWPGLWDLLNGADAPLVPYYAALKLVTSLGIDLAPSAVEHPELLYRMPSVAAAVLAVWVLAVWLGRRFSFGLAVVSVAALLATAGFSRYGQEARPYALVLLMAVLATVAWDRMAADRRWRWVPLYAVAVALLVAVHLLAGSLLVAHLLTAVVIGGTRRERLATLGRTALGAGLGLALVAPFAVPAAGHGVGPTKTPPVTWDTLSSTFTGLFTDSTLPEAGLAITLTLALAAIGVTAVLRRSSYGRVARIAAAWAIVPILVLLPVIFARPNLLIGRYLIFVLPGWAILAGLGAVTVAQLVRFVLTGTIRGAARGGAYVVGGVRGLQPDAGRVARPVEGAVGDAPTGPATSRRRHPLVASGAGGLAAILLLGWLGVTQVETLRKVRDPAGHSEDIRASLAAALGPEYAHLPIVISSLYSSLEIAAYHPGAEKRLVGQHIPRQGPSIWPAANPAPKPPTLAADAFAVPPALSHPLAATSVGLHPASGSKASAAGGAAGSRTPATAGAVSSTPAPASPADAAIARELGAHRRVILLLRTPSPASCRDRFPGRIDLYVSHCLPKPLKDMDYKVDVYQKGGYRWTFAVLTRPTSHEG
jgi:hypothetical protein